MVKLKENDLKSLIELDGAENKLYINKSPYIDATAFEKDEKNVIGVNVDTFGDVFYSTNRDTKEIKKEYAIASAHWNLMDLYMIGVKPKYAVIYYNTKQIDIPTFQSHISDYFKKEGVMIIGGETLNASNEKSFYGSITVVGESPKKDVVNLHEATSGQKIVQIVEYGNWLANSISLSNENVIWKSPFDSTTIESAQITKKYATGMKDMAIEGPINILSDIAGATGKSVHVNTDKIIYNKEAKEICSDLYDSHLDFLTEMDGFTFYATVPKKDVPKLQRELSEIGTRSSVVGELKKGNGVYIDGEKTELPIIGNKFVPVE